MYVTQVVVVINGLQKRTKTMNLTAFLSNIRSKINMVEDPMVRKGLLQTVKDFEKCTSDTFKAYLKKNTDE